MQFGPPPGNDDDDEEQGQVNEAQLEMLREEDDQELEIQQPGGEPQDDQNGHFNAQGQYQIGPNNNIRQRRNNGIKFTVNHQNAEQVTEENHKFTTRVPVARNTANSEHVAKTNFGKVVNGHQYSIVDTKTINNGEIIVEKEDFDKTTIYGDRSVYIPAVNFFKNRLDIRTFKTLVGIDSTVDPERIILSGNAIKVNKEALQSMNCRMK